MMVLYVFVVWTLVGMVTIGLLQIAKLLTRSSVSSAALAVHDDGGSFGAGAFWPPPLGEALRHAA